MVSWKLASGNCEMWIASKKIPEHYWIYFAGTCMQNIRSHAFLMKDNQDVTLFEYYYMNRIV